MTISTQIVIQGNNLDILPKIPDASIDAIVTDPPYGLAFMGKSWDKTLPDPRTWSEALRVLKPGGHAVIFGAPRLYHRLACAVEDAGFEVRDVLMWMFGSGFPKSLDVSKAIDGHLGAERTEVLGKSKRHGGGTLEGHGWNIPAETPDILAPATPEAAAWAGWGTALKPAYEPILLVRKPLVGTVAQNVLTHGTGGINVDACRVEGAYQTRDRRTDGGASMFGTGAGGGAFVDAAGRWPANVILDEEAGAVLDEQAGVRPVSGTARKGALHTQTPIGYSGGGSGASSKLPSDSGGASRFFYCPKASRSEREAGLEAFPARVVDESRREGDAGTKHARSGVKGARRNPHPTVKPLDLMSWCVKLITPPGGVVLDPFAGSGSTLAACASLGVSGIGIELDPEYVAIGNARIAHWSKKG